MYPPESHCSCIFLASVTVACVVPARGQPHRTGRDYTLHLAVPILRLGIERAEDFHMPLAAAPWLDHLGGNGVHEDLRKDPPLRIPFEVIGRFVPAEIRIQHQRQKEIVAIVDDDQLAAWALESRMVDEIFLGAMCADVTFERELAGNDLFDRDLLVPAVPAVLFFTSRLGHVFRAAE